MCFARPLTCPATSTRSSRCRGGPTASGSSSGSATTRAQRGSEQPGSRWCRTAARWPSTGGSQVSRSEPKASEGHEAVSRDRLVYSSQHGRTCPLCGRPVKQCVCRANPRGAEGRASGDGVVRVKREVAGRRGKPVTTIQGVPGGDDALREVAGELKRRGGSRGTAKDGVIEIQGDHRDAVIEVLEAKGFTVKRAGG